MSSLGKLRSGLAVALGLFGVPACDPELTPVDPQEFCDRVETYEAGEARDSFLRCDAWGDDAFDAGCADAENGIWVSGTAFFEAEASCEWHPDEIARERSGLVSGGPIQNSATCHDTREPQLRLQAQCYR